METSKLEHCAMCAFLLNLVVECSPKFYFPLFYFIFIFILFYFIFRIYFNLLYLRGLKGWRENLEHFHLVLLAALHASKCKYQKDCRNHCSRQDTGACSSLQRGRWVLLCVWHSFAAAMPTWVYKPLPVEEWFFRFFLNTRQSPHQQCSPLGVVLLGTDNIEWEAPQISPGMYFCWVLYSEGHHLHHSPLPGIRFIWIRLFHTLIWVHKKYRECRTAPVDWQNPNRFNKQSTDRHPSFVARA